MTRIIMGLAITIGLSLIVGTFTVPDINSPEFWKGAPHVTYRATRPPTRGQPVLDAVAQEQLLATLVPVLNKQLTVNGKQIVNEH